MMTTMATPTIIAMMPHHFGASPVSERRIMRKKTTSAMKKTTQPMNSGVMPEV